MIWTLRVTTGSDRLVLWDRFGLILHFLWAWQFALGCLIELALITSIALEGLAGAPIHDTTVRWVFVVLTFFLIITIVVQICIFANDCLCTNTYLWIQAVNVAYVTALYGIFAASMHHFDGGPLSLSLVWQITWQACVLWTPWIGSLWCAIKLKSQESLDARTETEPLLPRPLSRPRLTAQRR